MHSIYNYTMFEDLTWLAEAEGLWCLSLCLYRERALVSFNGALVLSCSTDSYHDKGL